MTSENRDVTPNKLLLGVDIIELDRIDAALRRWGEKFLARVYTPGERDFSRGRIPQLAGRFAAKEAVMKALGTGNRGVAWREIEVVRELGRAPQIHLHGRAVAVAKRQGIRTLVLSISHSRDYAVATVIGKAKNENRHK
jgi:holo-[acyl-carrier protein] synthase